jgi:hypothetical protein
LLAPGDAKAALFQAIPGLLVDGRLRNLLF